MSAPRPAPGAGSRGSPGGETSGAGDPGRACGPANLTTGGTCCHGLTRPLTPAVEDLERNDGSAARPYFMPKALLRILGKKNDAPPAGRGKKP